MLANPLYIIFPKTINIDPAEFIGMFIAEAIINFIAFKLCDVLSIIVVNKNPYFCGLFPHRNYCGIYIQDLLGPLATE